MVSVRIASAALCLGLAATGALAQAADAGRAQENLGAAEQELATSRSRESALAADVASRMREQDELSAKLVAAADDINLRQQALKDTSGRIGALDDEAATIRRELDQKRDVLAELLAGLQRLEQNPPPALAVAPGRILDALRGAMMFGSVVPELRGQSEHLVNRLERLEAIKAETDQARAGAEAQFAAMQEARDQLALLLQQRKIALAASQSDLVAEQRRISALTARVSNLRQLLAALADAEAKSSAEARARAEEEVRQRSLQAHPPKPFAQSRGRLEYPVQGHILARFGEPNRLGGTLNGLAIAADAGALVTTPADGKVAFAGPFRSYGNLLIIEAGDGYVLLLAGLATVDVGMGQLVRAGEPLGAMGKRGTTSGLLSSSVSDGRAVLYVEVRKNGEPADSSEWWIGSRKEAMQ